jgi:hypothetical protein
MNSPLPEQPSTRQIVLAFGVLCVGLILALWIVPMRVKAQSDIWGKAWQLEQVRINGIDQHYSGAHNFILEFIAAKRLATGYDGCNFFVFRVKDNPLTQTLEFGTGQMTLMGCENIYRETSTGEWVLVEEGFDGSTLVFPYLDNYEFSEDKLIFTSSAKDRQFIFRLISQTSEKALENYPLPFTFLNP